MSKLSLDFPTLHAILRTAWKDHGKKIVLSEQNGSLCIGVAAWYIPSIVVTFSVLDRSTIKIEPATMGSSLKMKAALFAAGGSLPPFITRDGASLFFHFDRCAATAEIAKHFILHSIQVAAAPAELLTLSFSVR